MGTPGNGGKEFQPTNSPLWDEGKNIEEEYDATVERIEGYVANGLISPEDACNLEENALGQLHNKQRRNDSELSG